MTNNEIIQLFNSKPRHAGRILGLHPETAYRRCFIEEAIKFDNGCLQCNKKFKSFISFNQGYRKFCSQKCAMNSPDIKSSREETCIKKYGVKNPFSSEKSRTNLVKSSMEKYGTTTPISSQIVKDRVRATLLQRYGTDHAFKVDSVKLLARENKVNNYSIDKWKSRIDIIEASRDVELIGDKSYKDGKDYTWIHNCGTEYKSKVLSGTILACPKCKAIFSSKGEEQLSEFISKFVTIKTRCRDIISPYELDIFCEEKSIAFEYNGDYFHSSAIKSTNYHLNKLEMCEDRGIKLIQIFEHQWINKRHIVESRILSALGLTQKIFARKCKLVQLTTPVATKFFEDNHIQGSVGASKKFGLIFNGELVAAMSFGKPRFAKNRWELLRYCSKTGTTVVGGASKLLASLGERDIITYADRCWSDGNLYRKIGFEEIKSSPPSYFYVNSDVKVSRFQAQKHKLVSLLGERFDPSLSETDNMKKAKYHQIFDCGNRVFILKE